MPVLYRYVKGSDSGSGYYVKLFLGKFVTLQTHPLAEELYDELGYSASTTGGDEVPQRLVSALWEVGLHYTEGKGEGISPQSITKATDDGTALSSTEKNKLRSFIINGADKDARLVELAEKLGISLDNPRNTGGKIHDSRRNRRTSSRSTSSQEEVNGEDVLTGLTAIAVIAVVVITGVAVVQVFPISESQEVNQAYSLNYYVDEDESATPEYSSHSLTIERKISDNSISRDEGTRVTFRISNPSENYVDGYLDINKKTSFRDTEKLFTMTYSLPPGGEEEQSFIIEGGSLINDESSYPITAEIYYDAEMTLDGYTATSSTMLSPSPFGEGWVIDESADENNEITIKKPLHERWGYYWLILIVLLTLSFATKKIYSKTRLN